ncbi:MAG: carboxyltransferase domain-containing protein [Rhodobacteraceae bacterium]|nr:carboxyltransferase domain-containing protein [Paracoccaceae bacterium]
MPTPQPFPRVAEIGLSGLLVSFGDRLDDRANRAALAFRAAAEAAGWPDLVETAPSLASVHLEFAPLHAQAGSRSARIDSLLASRDWMTAPLPQGRRRWTIPAVFGGPLAPQLSEAAALGNADDAALIAALCGAPLRVLTLGFAPGQPYLGTLPDQWDIPRQTSLTRMVPEGAIVLAVRQLVLFSRPSPTGWRHVAQSAFRCFRPDSPSPFPLVPGDEIALRPITEDALNAIRAQDTTGDGGAACEDLS